VLDFFGGSPFADPVLVLVSVVCFLVGFSGVVAWTWWQRRRARRAAEEAEAARRMDARMEAVRALVEGEFVRFRKAKRR
jgi:predicted negative regulator of RcsB-dependent stress response